MSDLRVNTDAVLAMATKINNTNIKLRDSFDNVRNAISTMNGKWDGQASEVAINKFNQIQNIFPEARYKELNNFVQIMMVAVGQGYEQVETANTSLADLFK